VSIPEHRQAIDRLDAQIVRLLNERTKHVLAIGDIKLKAGEEIYAPHRERAVLDRICRLNAGPMTGEQLRAIYREIMSSALALEKTMTIAYLGPEATFTHQAAIRKFGASLRYTSQKTITDVFAEVSKTRADYGVVPVENTTEGVVTHTLDMFVDSDLKIVSQIVLPIQYCLAGHGKTENIQRLYAHPQALAQCRSWVQKNLPRAEILETSSNARSAELVAHPTVRKTKLRGKVAAITGCREVWPGSGGAGHPGQRRQRHPLSRVGPPMPAAHGRRPHQSVDQRGRQGRRPASGHRRVPPLPHQHDQD